MKAKTDLWYLENVDLKEIFCAVPPQMSMSTMASHTPKIIPKGSFIYFPNDSSNKIFFIEKGRVKIGSYSEDGKEIIKAVLQEGEIFGELGLVGESQRNEFAQAMEPSCLCVMPLDQVKEMMQLSQTFGLQITKLIGKKLVKAQRRLESLVFKDARSRVIEFLRDLAMERGRRVGYELLVRRFFTHQDIANLTGTSRQTVTTILNELRQENYIYFDRKKLLIRDLKKLAALID